MSMTNDVGPVGPDAGPADQDAGAAGPPADQVEDASVFVVRALLCLSSYTPLFVILAIRFQGTALKAVCAALAAAGLLYLVLVVFVIRAFSQSRQYLMGPVDDASSQVAGYLATYLVPFVTVPSPSGADIAGYCILAVVVAVIFIRSDDLARINPTLYLLGWRVASIESGGAKGYLVCRRLPRTGTIVHAVKVAGLLIRKEPH
jgi:hypothetical protein